MAVAAALTPAVRLFALRRGLLDHALGARKIHGKAVPRLGGLAIVGGFYAPLCALLVYRTGLGFMLFADRARLLGLLGGGLAIAALGLVDDLRGLGAGLKLLVQLSVALVLYQLGFRIEHLATPWGVPVELGVLSLPITLLWIAGVVNAMNLIDGLDGLAGGVALFALGTTFAVAVFRAEPLMALFAAALAGSVAGFLFYNFNPASIFMGDTGSMFLGFILAASSIWTHQKSSTAVALLVPVVALGLPIADTLLAILRRALRGQPLFSADREHIHHRLLALGLSHRQAVLVLYGACVVLGVAALLLSFANSAQTAAVLSVLSLVGFFAVRRLGLLQRLPALATGEPRLSPRALVRTLSGRLQRAATQVEIWDAVKLLLPALRAARLQLSLTAGRDSGERVTTLFQLDGKSAGRTPFQAVFSIGEDAGRLELTWDDGRAVVEHDDELAAEVLCDHLAAALARFAAAAPSATAPAARANVIPLSRQKQ
jgi:UDP-GlcNAc:undecaprenyl-phosphate GlcNAc-1-phosphate transferase